MKRGPAVSQEPFTACASSPYPLRTPPGSSASIASKPAILAKIMHRRPAADLSDRPQQSEFNLSSLAGIPPYKWSTSQRHTLTATVTVTLSDSENQGSCCASPL